MENETKELKSILKQNKENSSKETNEENGQDLKTEKKVEFQTETKVEEKKENEENKEKHVGIIKCDREDATKAVIDGGWKTKRNKRKGKRALERDMIEDELLYKNLFQINIPHKPLLC